MNHATSSANAAFEERFGRQVAERLTTGNRELPHDLGERLRVARMQAVARRKTVPVMRTAPVVVASGGAAATLGGGWWGRAGAALSLVALVAGLMTISTLQDNNHAREAAEVDSALLTDDLPPAAFTDPGFAQFLKSTDSGTAR
ncbi:MAG: hypothetical protein JWQ03_2528 [Variovorax sp.]|nr:hypothetical protein [Variovorax sp.]